MIQLYSFPLSQHCRRVLALLEAAGIGYDTVHVALEKGEHMAPGFLAVNPNHQVPTLVDGEVKLHESNAILRYLCAKHGLDDWYPADPAARARVDQWLDWCQCRLGPAVIDIVYNSVFAGDAGDKAAIQRGHEKMAELAPILENALENAGYLAGDGPTIADLAAASNITHLGFADARPATPNIQAWLGRMTAIDGFRKTLPPPLAA